MVLRASPLDLHSPHLAASAGSIPTTALTEADLTQENRLAALVAKCGLCKSNGEARKTIQQGGLYIGEDKVTDTEFRVTADMLRGEGLLIRKGKKAYHRFQLAE